MDIFAHYTYGDSPELLPLEDYSGGSAYDELVASAGFDPEDAEIVVCQLAANWNGHRAGAVVITGLTAEGHPFAVENPVGPLAGLVLPGIVPGSDYAGQL